MLDWWTLMYGAPLALASAAGLIFGFGRHWERACLWTCGAVPVIIAVVSATALDTSWANRSVWMVIYLLGWMIWTFLAWGFFALVHHGAHKLYKRAMVSRQA